MKWWIIIGLLALLRLRAAAPHALHAVARNPAGAAAVDMEHSAPQVGHSRCDCEDSIKGIVMGYYTRFEIEIDRGATQVMDTLIKTMDYGEFQQNSETEWSSAEQWKWYGHEDNLKAVSKAHPLSLITVTGYGEEQGDIWRKYFLAGQMQTCKLEIKFPPCTLVRPDVKIATIDVTVMGHDVPVEIEYIAPKTADELYEMAKAQLKSTL